MSKDKETQTISLLDTVGAALFDKCINNLNDAILITKAGSLNGTEPEIIWANKAFYLLTGYSASDIIGKSIKILGGSLTDKTVLKDLFSSLEKGISRRLELLSYRKDGTTYWNESEITPIANEEHVYTHWISVQRDISEKKIIEEEFKKQDERYRLASEGANVGIWDWNILTDEVYYSPVWKSMLGYKEDEIKADLSEWKRLLHPDDYEYALSKAEAFLNNKSDKYQFEFRLKHKDGHYVDILSHAFSIEDNKGKIKRLVGTHVDITVRKQAENTLRYQSTHDNLTGLVNRTEFERRATRLLSNVNNNDQEHALCYLDLDQFKLVNDTCGHVAGDELLRQLGSLLGTVLRERDTLARLGGDEFGMLIEHCSIENAYRVATAIQTAIQDYQFIWEGQSFRISASIGLVPITGTERTLTELLKDADTACFMAKDLGRNRIQVYREDDIGLSQRHGEMQWVSKIQKALTEDRFVLYAQVIEPLSNNDSSIHYEILVRMLDEDEKIVPPGAFLPAAERYSLITQVDKWVVSNVFRLLKGNPLFLDKINYVSINLSGPSLTDAAFLSFVENEFHNYNIDGNKICFEITETAAISHLGMAEKFLAKLQKLGCNFALDDFGSGLSSYGYLKNLPVDYLKIDGIFVKDILEDKIDLAMVKSINEIGQVMGMKTIAEFVENEKIRDMLKNIGVNYVQGYAVGKPQPFDKILR